MRKVIKDLHAYIPAPLENVNLAMNENHHIDWSDKLPQPVKKVADSYMFSAYGDSKYTALTEVYGAYTGLSADCVLPFSGSESAISVLMNSLAEQDIMLFTPDFFRFFEIADVLGRKVHTIDISGQVDADAIIAKILAEKVELCLFSTPNNPLGVEIPRTLIERMLQETDAYIVADEAYIEFGGTSVVDLIPQFDKLLVMRTTSKAWGLAGMRIGFVLANPKMIDFLKKAVGPFHINTISTEIVAHAMEHYIDYMQENVDAIIAARSEWEHKLTNTYGMRVYPSSTNFIYAMSDAYIDIWQFLKDNRVHVSKFAPSGLRISIGNPAEMEILEQQLDHYFSQKK